MIDVTSSMKPYIEKTKENVQSIVEKVKEAFENARVRVALVGYRDFESLYLRRKIKPKHFEIMDFTEDASDFIAFIKNIKPDGGADYPEDVLGAINKTIHIKWNAANRIILHIGNYHMY